MSPPPRAICFDMDGVLVQSEEHWKARQREHILPTTAPEDTIPTSAITGRSYKEVYPDLADEYEVTISRSEFEGMFETAAEDIYGDLAPLMDGLDELLSDLRDAGVALALTTSAPRAWIEAIDERFGLLAHFDAVVSADDLDGPGKPDPLIYETGAAELGVDPSACWAVEDSTAGARAAVAAGMTTVGYRAGDSEADLSMADHVATSPAELRAVLFGEA